MSAKPKRFTQYFWIGQKPSIQSPSPLYNLLLNTWEFHPLFARQLRRSIKTLLLRSEKVNINQLRIRKLGVFDKVVPSLLIYLDLC